MPLLGVGGVVLDLAAEHALPQRRRELPCRHHLAAEAGVAALLGHCAGVQQAEGGRHRQVGHVGVPLPLAVELPVHRLRFQRGRIQVADVGQVGVVAAGAQLGHLLCHRTPRLRGTGSATDSVDFPRGEFVLAEHRGERMQLVRFQQPFEREADQSVTVAMRIPDQLPLPRRQVAGVGARNLGTETGVRQGPHGQ